MGMAAALKLRPLLSNLTAILAIELLAACQAIDLLAPLRTGRLAEKAKAMLRAVSPPVTKDRPLYRDIARVAQLVFEGAFAEVLTAK
jgi:histidine ammonia-lyase